MQYLISIYMHILFFGCPHTLLQRKGIWGAFPQFVSVCFAGRTARVPGGDGSRRCLCPLHFLDGRPQPAHFGTMGCSQPCNRFIMNQKPRRQRGVFVCVQPCDHAASNTRHCTVRVSAVQPAARGKQRRTERVSVCSNK